LPKVFKFRPLTRECHPRGTSDRSMRAAFCMASGPRWSPVAAQLGRVPRLGDVARSRRRHVRSPRHECGCCSPFRCLGRQVTMNAWCIPFA
jgi:hypothetical protein